MKLSFIILFIFSTLVFPASASLSADSIINQDNRNLIKGNIPEELIDSSKHNTEFFPIIMFDSEIGFGYGAKAFFINYLGSGESFDLTLFNSTKGERWYRFAFSYPDNEQRQGKLYPFAIDFIVDYDKYIKNNFFGIGNESRYFEKETYTKEPLVLNLNFSHAFTEYLVILTGINFRYVRNYNFESNSKLLNLKPELNSSIVRYNSILFNLRYDSRNSFINPSKGTVLQGEYESAFKTSFTNICFNKFSFWVHNYTTIRSAKIILASRMQFQTYTNAILPVQVLLSAGGGQSLRGFSQDRFIDKTLLLFNEELRIPIYKRLGCIIGIDIAKVWEKPGLINLKNWKFNLVSGLRFYMDNFVVRMDVGFGQETTSLFFNFGHLF